MPNECVGKNHNREFLFRGAKILYREKELTKRELKGGAHTKSLH